jgi:hypothetical protein
MIGSSRNTVWKYRKEFEVYKKPEELKNEDNKNGNI